MLIFRYGCKVVENICSLNSFTTTSKLVTENYKLNANDCFPIFPQIFGKKTIEQLLWEQQQSRLGEQDKLVRDYLEEKHYINDRLTPSYNKLKNELNKYRHWEILCAYEKVCRLRLN